MTEELKPCPFCNGLPQKREVNHWTGMRNDLLRVEFIHHCEGLKPRQRATLNVSAVTEEEAIEAWNRRATPAPAQPDPLHVANERGEGWQPIESVPKSPVPVLLFTRGGVIRIETGWYAVNLLAEAVESGEECVFTHWAPLPAAPKEKP